MLSLANWIWAPCLFPLKDSVLNVNMLSSVIFNYGIDFISLNCSADLFDADVILSHCISGIIIGRVLITIYNIYEYPTKLWHDQSSLEWTCRLQEFTKPS